MGLIKAAVGAAGGVLADSWRDYIYCDSMDAEVLMCKGQKRTSDRGRSSNTKGESNIISNGSVVAVNEGQCMLIVEQGKITEVCAEPGEFTYDTSTEPSIFYGDLGDTIVASFERLGRRLGFGGDTGNDQRVYFVNTKEIVGNKYGTATPIPFRIVDLNVGIDMDTKVRMNGVYSYCITDPVKFYTEVCANVEGEYRRSEIDTQMKGEVLTALQPALAQISAQGIRYSAIPAHAKELARALNEEMSSEWRDLRGIEIKSFTVNSVSIPEADEERIKNVQMNMNPNMAAANLAAAQQDAMRSAASNENGAMNAFMGMGMASNAGGMNVNSVFQNGGAGGAGVGGAGQNYAAASDGGFSTAGGDEWVCECGATNTKKFCGECGKPRPETEWVCECGATNTKKFCGECGKPRP